MNPQAATADRADLDALRAGLDGGAVVAGDAEYDAARTVFNAAIDRRPAIVVRAAGAADVARAIAFARERGRPLTVRGGGHGFAGHAIADGGVVVDTAALRAIDVDVDRREVRAGAGLTAGELTAATTAHGLAVGFGDTGTVGIAGITLGGGIGWLTRKHGLTIDSLLGAELVTADGEVVEVDAEREPDLLWALRGGGGNVGVVTQLRFGLHEVGTILGGELVLPPDPAVLAALLDLAAEAPDELTTILHVSFAPPVPFVPAEHHGKLVIFASIAWTGDLEEGERIVARLRALAPPIVDLVRPMPYPELLSEGPPRGRMAVGNAFAGPLGLREAEAILDRIRAVAPAPLVIQLRVLGGAVARVPADATAFAHRDKQTLVIVGAPGLDPADDVEALETRVADTIAGLGLLGGGAYVNYLGADGAARIGEAYPAATLARLARIKREHDPQHVFRGHLGAVPA